MKVPFLDLQAQDREVGAEVRAAIDEVLASQHFILSPVVERFEAAMAAYCGVAHAIGVGSGTDALLLSLTALGAGPGTAVLTTPFSFWATASTILRVGAEVVFADIDPLTFNLDVGAASEAIARHRGELLVGMVPVHLFGQLADMAGLEALAQRRGLWILEDAAQAIGATRADRRAGAFGAAGTLSFFPTKNLGGVGDGGMVVTTRAEVAARIRQDRHQGQAERYAHASLGMCSRLDALQAAALSAKLPRLDSWNERRRRVATWYGELLEQAGLMGRSGAPLVGPAAVGPAHVFHQYVVRARERDALRAHLAARGIASMIYYPSPLHLQPALAELGFRRGALPEAERACDEVVALPIYPELPRERVEMVVEAVAGFYAPRAL